MYSEFLQDTAKADLMTSGLCSCNFIILLYNVESILLHCAHLNLRVYQVVNNKNTHLYYEVGLSHLNWIWFQVSDRSSCVCYKVMQGMVRYPVQTPFTTDLCSYRDTRLLAIGKTVRDLGNIVSGQIADYNPPQNEISLENINN